MSYSFDELAPLKYWCYKILPLVYDDSLSYYEVLCKVTEKLNALIENNNQLPAYIKELVAEGGFLDGLQEQIAELNDGNSETATADRFTGQLIWLNGNLYRITRDMLAGDQYTESSEGVTGNIEKITIEEWHNRFEGYIKSAIVSADQKYNILSDSNFSTGSLLWWKGKLYKATTDIVKNAYLSTDINLTEVSVEELINKVYTRIDELEKYPIYYPEEERMEFNGTTSGTPVIVTKADTHVYSAGDETISIVPIESEV